MMRFRYFSSLVLLSSLVLGGCTTGMVSSSGHSRQATTDEPPLYLRMTDRDVVLADRAVQEALESSLSDFTRLWENPRSGNSGRVTPLRTFQNARGYYCRTYRESLQVEGERESYTDTACRDDDGQWYPI